MSYKVLALRWRPRTFAELVGQEHVVRALVNSLEGQRLHHAYLFAGTRGVGKTTIARILAKALNCTKDGVTAEPCGECSACKGIDEGRFVDLIEVDAASRTKVDDTRELLDNVQYAPSQGRYKVYLIDEVHMLSNHSFNALLKTLEEPPPHVKFLFATTDPQKLPVTVLSRCLQFNLKRLPQELIVQQLQKITKAEEVTFEQGALDKLARAADGSMRDGLSLLDQAIAYCGGKLEQTAIEAMLGTVDRSHGLAILGALSTQDGGALLEEVARLAEFAPDYAAILDDLMGLLQRIAVLQLVGAESLEPEDADALAELSESMSPEDVQLYYQIALQGRRDLPVVGDPRSGLEMVLLRMLAFRPAQESEAPANGKRRGGEPAKPGPSPTDKPGLVNKPSAGTSQSSTSPSLDVAAIPQTTPEPVPEPIPKPAQAATAEPVGEVDWFTLVPKLDLRGPGRQLAEHAELAAIDGNGVRLKLMAGKENLNTNGVRRRLEGAIGQALGRSIRLTVDEACGQDTPAARRLAAEDQRMREARTAIETDPNVKALQDTFGAVVETDTIRPVD
jgi:DNA polymerase-3 subunit gamma/tau